MLVCSGTGGERHVRIVIDLAPAEKLTGVEEMKTLVESTMTFKTSRRKCDTGSLASFVSVVTVRLCWQERLYKRARGISFDD